MLELQQYRQSYLLALMPTVKLGEEVQVVLDRSVGLVNMCHAVRYACSPIGAPRIWIAVSFMKVMLMTEIRAPEKYSDLHPILLCYLLLVRRCLP